MPTLVSLLFVGWMCLGFSSVLTAQISQPPVPLELQGEPRTTQIPPYSALTTPQCDGSGDVYLNLSSQSEDASTTSVVSVEPDGNTQTISLPSTSQTNSHVFVVAAAADGSMHEVARVPDSSQQAPTVVSYFTFDSDGSLRSQADFGQEFIPSLLLPLPDGSFFASGMVMKTTHDAISEVPLAGIFSSDAILVRKLEQDPPASQTTPANAEADSESSFDGGLAKLGGDGNIYVLLSGDKTRIAVISEAGQITRELTLQEPFAIDAVRDLWVSGNRILVEYEGATENPKDGYLYVVYDAQSGNVIRAYHPEFSGTIACFQDGQTLSVLLRQTSSGKTLLGTAELR